MRILIVMLMSIVFSFISWCSWAAKPKIAILMYGVKAEYVQMMERYANEHPAVKNGTIDITIYDGRYDALVQNDQADTAIRTGHNAIIIAPMDFNANVDIATKAKEAGIPLIVTNTRMNTSEINSQVASDDVLGGYMEAKVVMDKLNCKGNIVIIEGPIGQSAEVERGEGNDKAIKECGDGIKVLERKTANWSRAEAMSLMENWLLKHKGKIDGIIGQNDEMALGAIEAIKSSGLNVSDYSIVGVDGVTDALLAVQKKEMISILQDAKGQIQGSIDIAIKLIDPSYKPQSDTWERYKGELSWDDGKSKRYNIPWIIVTQDNVAKLLESRQ